MKLKLLLYTNTLLNFNKAWNNVNKWKRCRSRKSQVAVCLLCLRPSVQSDDAETAADEPQAIPDVSVSLLLSKENCGLKELAGYQEKYIYL